MNILWIKDGKLGHEKQVKALLEELSKEIQINVIEYQPEGILTKKFKYLFSPLSTTITNQDIRDINLSCNENNISMEQYTSLKGIQSIYSNYSEIPINELCNESIYANEIFSRALKNEQAALLTCADITKYMSIFMPRIFARISVLG